MARASNIAASIILACVVLLTQVAAIGHVLTTQHSICDEHGELTHADGVAEVQGVAAGSTDLLASLPDAAHEHGCSLLTGLVQPVAPSPPAPALAEPEPPEPLEPAPPAPGSTACPERLAFAPKTSPPGRSTTS